MMRHNSLFAVALLGGALNCGADYEPAPIVPPALPAEFRAAWVTEVATNPDWPSRPGLSVAEQKREMIALLDRAAELHLNAIVFQVRPACDAFYASPLEPWSEHLTGVMGRAPAPFYDPLAFAVDEAHRRGLELHAWFNPFRAVHPSAHSPISPNHISRTRPDLVRHYGSQVWLDPGEPEARDHVLEVVLDVVKRYDVDGIQFDDYFYPYKEKDAAGRVLNFPDDASWKKHGVHTGLARDDWRRENINGFIQSVYQSIKTAKPWVKFGVSPFGIWRPGNPPGVKGMDAYTEIYADARQWFASGWVDYLSPQLYWPMDQVEQSFTALLGWWARQNLKARHLWPGLNAVNVSEKWKPDEFVRQVQAIRSQPAGGEIFFHLNSLTQNRGLNGALAALYAEPALVPASPWLSAPPGKPLLTATNGAASATKVLWRSAGHETIRLWLLQTRSNGVWSAELLPPASTARVFAGAKPEVIAVSALDRAGNLSPAAVVALKKLPEPPAMEKSPEKSEKPSAHKKPLRKFVTPKNGGR